MQFRLDYINFPLSNFERKNPNKLDSDLGKMLLKVIYNMFLFLLSKTQTHLFLSYYNLRTFTKSMCYLKSPSHIIFQAFQLALKVSLLMNCTVSSNA